MAKQPFKKLKPQPASPPPGLGSATATSPLFPEPPLSPFKKPRGKGKPFVKGEDTRRVHGRKGGQVNASTSDCKKCCCKPPRTPATALPNFSMPSYRINRRER